MMAGDIVFVQIKHPDDAADSLSGKNQLALNEEGFVRALRHNVVAPKRCREALGMFGVTAERRCPVHAVTFFGDLHVLAMVTDIL